MRHYIVPLVGIWRAVCGTIQTMTRILATALALTVAALALCGSLWRRDAASLVVARADAQRSSAAVTAAQKRETRCLGMVDAERAEVAACRRSADEAMSEARETERKACGRLVEAARAQGRLDVDPTDVSAVVRALRARRR